MTEVKNEYFFKHQNYINDRSIVKARMAFKIRCQMVKNIPGNFKNKFRKIKKIKGVNNDESDEGLVCSYCSQGIMTQAHCLLCPALCQLREGLDVKKIDGMVTFFQKLMEKIENKQ